MMEIDWDSEDDCNLPEKTRLFKSWVKFISTDQQWTSFLTLTFSDKILPHGITEDNANKSFTMMLRVLNTGVFGRHYTRICGHSYFGYAKCTEMQSREVLHFHVMTTSCVNWSLVHRYWGRYCGFAWIKPVTSIKQCCEYLAKYVMKEGYDLDYYKPKKSYLPRYLPDWWKVD